MGIFSTGPQVIIDASANKVFQSMDKLGVILDSNGGRLNQQGNIEIRNLDLLIGEFHRLCNIHNSTVKTIKLDGASQPLFSIITMLNAFMREVSMATGYVFECKKKM